MCFCNSREQYLSRMSHNVLISINLYVYYSAEVLDFCSVFVDAGAFPQVEMPFSNAKSVLYK